MRAATAFLLLAATLAGADRAQLSGVVRDSSSAAIPDAAVSLLNLADGLRRTTRTDAEGAYLIAGLIPGFYKITVRKTGFQTLVRTNFQLSPNESVDVDFSLQLGSVHEVITVEDAPSILRSDDATVTALFGKKWLNDLPLNGRGVLAVVDLAPGLVATPATSGEAGQFSVNGQRANTNYFLVDGVSANNSVTGGGLPAQFGGGSLPAMSAFGSSHSLASLDEVQEVLVETSSYAPEHGRRPGAQVALNTRSGTNDWHGSLNYAWRRDPLAANDWFANARAAARQSSALDQASGTFGGPIRRDRSFFFAAAERLSLAQPFLTLSNVPSLEARRAAPPAIRPLLDAYPLPTGETLGDGTAGYFAQMTAPSHLTRGSFRLDHTVSSNATVFIRYNQAPSSAEHGFAYRERSEFNFHSLTGGATVVAGPSWTLDARLSFTSSTAASFWANTGFGGAQAVDLRAFFPSTLVKDVSLFGIAIGGLGRLVQGEGGENRQWQWNLTGTAAYNRSRHGIRFGYDYQRLNPSRNGQAVHLAGSYSNFAALRQGAPLSVTELRSPAASSLIETLSLFAQDTWNVTPRLNLVYGIRWELTPPPSFRQIYSIPPAPAGLAINVLPSIGITDPLWRTRYTQFAPRFGVTYRLSQRSVLRAGWGLFYDLGFSIATDPVNGFPFNRWQFGGERVGVALSSPNPPPIDLRIPYSHQWNVTYEAALTPTDVVSAAYVGSSGRRLLRREGYSTLDPQLAGLLFPTNHGWSHSHGLQLQYRRRLRRNVQIMGSYTWSHALDNGSFDSSVSITSAPAAPVFTGSDTGRSAFDVRQVFSSAISWDLPRPFRDWRLSGLVHARSGFPIDVLSYENLLGLGFDDYPRPDLVPGVPVWIHDPAAPGGRRLNRDAFKSTYGRQGTLGRNAISGFPMWQTDLALERRFQLGERAAVSLRADAFNAFNHPLFADPIRHLDNPFFGLSPSMLNLMLGSGTPRSGLAPSFQMGGPRSLQFSLRFSF